MQRDLKDLHLRRNKFKFEKYIRSFDREKERLVSNELHHVDGTRGWLAVGQDSFDLPRHRLSRIWRYASPLGIHTLGDRRRLWEASRGKEQSGVSIFEKYLLKQREREKKKKNERDGWKGNFAGTWIREYFNNLDSRVLRESRQKWLVPLYNPFVASRIIRAEEHIFPRSEELSRFSKRTFPSFRFSICWTNGKKHRSKSVPYHIPPPLKIFSFSHHSGEENSTGTNVKYLFTTSRSFPGRRIVVHRRTKSRQRVSTRRVNGRARWFPADPKRNVAFEMPCDRIGITRTRGRNARRRHSPGKWKRRFKIAGNSWVERRSTTIKKEGPRGKCEFLLLPLEEVVE